MRNWGMLVLGGFLIILGILSALSAIFNINLWMVCWPTLLILIGVLLLLGPRIDFPAEGVKIRPLLNIRRQEQWSVSNEEIWCFVGNAYLDFRNAEIPSGLTTIRLVGFVGDIDLFLVEGIEYAIASTAFLTDSKITRLKDQTFINTFRYKTNGYDSASRKISIETLFFVNDLDVRQS